MSEETTSRNNKPDNVLVALEEEQSKSGHLSPEFMQGLADSLDIPVNDVYGVASFYSFLSIRPMGKNVIRICRSVPCYLKHSQVILEAIKKEIGIGPGETTPDQRFSLELTNCIGLCDGSPAMLINHDAHVNLTPEKVSRILQSYK